MLTVSDVMDTNPFSFSSNTTLQEAITHLCHERINGAPVVTDDGHIVGFISEHALLDILFDPRIRTTQISQYMPEEVHSVAESDSLMTAVHMFVLHGVQRLPVVKNGKLVGVLSRRDLLLHSMHQIEPLCEPFEEWVSGIMNPQEIASHQPGPFGNRSAC